MPISQRKTYSHDRSLNFNYPPLGNHANEDLEAVLPVMILMMVDQKRKWNQKEIKRGEDQGPLSNHQRNPVKRNLKKNPAQRILQVIQINFGWVDCCFHNNRNKFFILNISRHHHTSC